MTLAEVIDELEAISEMDKYFFEDCVVIEEINILLKRLKKEQVYVAK